MEKCDNYKKMMMGLMDNELDPEEASEMNGHLGRCRTCRKEYEELRESSDVLKGLTHHGDYDIELDRIWKSPYSRFAKKSGIFMVLISWIIITVYSVFTMLSGPKEFIPRITSVIFILGILILLLTAVRDRIKTYKNDPYKEVDR